jgi:hypothetical protein
VRFVDKIKYVELRKLQVSYKTSFSVGPSGAEAAPSEESLSRQPLPTGAITKVQDFQKLAGCQGDPAAPPPYSPDLAPVDFFLFQKVKEQLAGLHLTQESLRSVWEGVTHTIAQDEFATAFRQ